LVPLVAVLPRSEFSVVFVEKDGKAHERLVKFGILDGSRIQIVEGLEPGENLIVDGHRALAGGDLVRASGSVEASAEVSK